MSHWPALAETTAVILAGGHGMRLRKAVNDRPKVLAEVTGRPFLSFLLDTLVAARLRDVVLCTGYRAEQVRDTYGDRYGPLRVKYSQEDAPLGTAGALRHALSHVSASAFLAMNGDSFCAVDLAAFWEWSRCHDAMASLVLVTASNTSRFGRVEVTEEGLVTEFREKSKTPVAGWLNAGVYAMRRSLLADVPVGIPVSVERDVFPRYIGRGLLGFRTAARFLDIGLPEDYRAAPRFFAEVTA